MTRWAKSRLGDVADLCLGKMLDEQKNKGDLLPYLANVNVRWGEFDLENLREMRFAHNEMDRYGLKFGDIVMCEGGEPGRCAIWKESVPGTMIQKALHRIRPHKCLDYRYLFYFFLHTGRTGGFAPLFTGATIKHLPKQSLSKLEIEYPPLGMQERIAELLSTYDDLIENNRRRMSLLEESARLLYREWFVRLRFPGYEHTPIVDSVPQGWERRTAFDSMHVLSGGTPKTSMPDYWDGETPFFTPKDATDGIWVSTCERSVTELGIQNCNSKLYPRDTVFITARGTVGKLNMAQVPMAMSQSCYALVGKDHLSQRFVYSAMEAGVDALRQQAVGAVFDAIVVDTFKRINLMVPPVPLLHLFDEATAPIFDQVESLTQQNEKLRAARDLLLPRLMSGELAV
ncbi:restriction endonuclease subunit S [Hydrogenophaga sp.]|uniref:restriction endonuclease subunit S n=1 Tax=Hydrogenophaga sp. TaxID=1904254 RepID=UPI00260AEC3B|nr:restriction endonuclease subunit S [Hydrogenophaga sp.]MDM7948289.1 restriction endonuclease subunit S [Hydrogenophaga sp.]